MTIYYGPTIKYQSNNHSNIDLLSLQLSSRMIESGQILHLLPQKDLVTEQQHPSGEFYILEFC